MIEYLESSLSISSIGHVNVLRIVAVAFDAQGHLSIVYPYSNEHDLLTWLKKTRTAVFSGPKSQVRSLLVVYTHTHTHTRTHTCTHTHTLQRSIGDCSLVCGSNVI